MIEISLEISKEQLVEGYCNRGLLFILSRCVFKNNNPTEASDWLKMQSPDIK